MFDAQNILTLIAALGCGLAAGVFLAFSTFVMNALARLPAEQGIAAMQSINVAVINVPFMGTLFGTALLCIVLAVMSGMHWQRAGAGWTMGGCGLYLVGVIGMTIVFHVPRNDTLAGIDARDPASAAQWATYVSEWTLGNHVRTLSALAAAALLTVAMVLRSASKA